ncbi:MAG TPA: response regulator [Burkholderiales bacterium]|nr:response regulator [Burkholderiales bacterium]
MKVLIADDDEVARAALTAALERLGHEVVACEDGAHAWQLLEAPDAPALAVLDWMMPAPDGVEICRRLRARNRRPYQYVILLTSRGRASDVTDGFEGGADDYLRKPLDPRELRARLHKAERVLLLQDEMRAQATIDEPTGLLNGAGIRERLQQRLAESARTGTPVSAIVVQLAEAVDDERVRQAVWRMTAHLRPYDEMGRVAGAEFLAVLPACGKAEATAAAERMRASLAEPFDPSVQPVRINASVGVATADSSAPLDADALIAAADAALA